ncbi:ribosomal protein S18-alanine N-acetyltransferase [Desulfovibrio sp. TomC]|uniref:ribosomal protein S18-alanine N-acetyltransferase n=1 Tax=Desulfovibrio sp. TomC TaxID=1562888 RepID=UPI0005BDA740|nr:ribosomal protein S18-alanine N-acetyltransferase [Desulfovibrio sp. TomC]
MQPQPPFSDPVRLGPADAALLAGLEARAFPDAWDEAAFVAALARPVFAAFGIRQENGLAAYATFHFLGEEFEVVNIATDPGLRGRGMASRLLGHVLQHTDKAGMNQGYLEVRAGNVPAKKLYLRHGFAVVGVRKRYYADNGEDALIMVRFAGQEQAVSSPTHY